VPVSSTPVPRCVLTPLPPIDVEARLAELFARAQANDLVAFEELYRLTKTEVSRTLLHLVGSLADLEVLMQEVYGKLLRAIRRGGATKSFRTLLYRVCAAVAIARLRWWKRRRAIDVATAAAVAPATGDPERALHAARIVQAALSKLSTNERLVFVFHELVGLGAEDIALVLEQKPSAVRRRLDAARESFTACLGNMKSVEVAP
jgi:RNA polymerase sigma-70 factor, ECF subfamily